jgi:predicted nucleotidyltransferase component of viral defense system
MNTSKLQKAQRQILELVSGRFSSVYLVGGTALHLLYNHRMSEDLDFFTQNYSSRLHRGITDYIKREKGFRFTLIHEEKRKKYLPMAVYELEIGVDAILKVDFVKDFVPLIQAPDQRGIANINDIYFRKILAVVGWKSGESFIGSVMAGGRQKTKDLFDVFFLSAHVKPLSEWFPQYFDEQTYRRLVAWYSGVPRHKSVMELLDLVPGCDAKALFKHLDEEIIHTLNRRYIKL